MISGGKSQLSCKDLLVIMYTLLIRTNFTPVNDMDLNDLRKSPLSCKHLLVVMCTFLIHTNLTPVNIMDLNHFSR